MLNDLKAGQKMCQAALVRVQKVGTSSNGGVFARGMLEDNGGHLAFICFDAVLVEKMRNLEGPTAYMVGGDVDINKFANDMSLQLIIRAIGGKVEKFEYTSGSFDNSFDMLEIPLFDMHWGIAFLDYYESTLKTILDLIRSHKWKKIVIPFGQDFFHNDSIVKGQTTKGTNIEKVDMIRA